MKIRLAVVDDDYDDGCCYECGGVTLLGEYLKDGLERKWRRLKRKFRKPEFTPVTAPAIDELFAWREELWRDRGTYTYKEYLDPGPESPRWLRDMIQATIDYAADPQGNYAVAGDITESEEAYPDWVDAIHDHVGEESD